MNEQIEQISIGALKPNRLRAELRNLEGLADSIKARGIIEPLLVRDEEQDDNCQVIDGDRRLAAASLAGLETVPCIVRKMTDQEVTEIQLIKALQREDFHPYDEAKVMVSLLESNQQDYDAVAAKIGKNVQYVRRRIVLARLIEPAAKAFLANEMSRDNAFRLARLDPKQQEQLVKLHRKDDNWNYIEWRSRELFHDLKNAPWKLDDADLYPKAGPCTTCPKQTGAQTALSLFDDLEAESVCTDAICFAEKLKFHIQSIEKADPSTVQISEHYGAVVPKGVIKSGDYKQLPASADKCPNTKPAVIVDGQSPGKQTIVCTDKKCKVHAKTRDAGMFSSQPEKTPEQKQERQKELRQTKITKALAELVLRKVLEVSDANEGMRDIARKVIINQLWSLTPHDSKKLVCAALSIEPEPTTYGGKDFDGPVREAIDKTSDRTSLRRLGLTFSIVSLFASHAAESVDTFSKLFKIDLKGLRKMATEQVDTKQVKPKMEKSKPRPRSKKKGV